MSGDRPILVTGAGGSVGAVGRTVVENLRAAGLPVRALVRTEDERAQALRATGAEVVVGDLTLPADVARAVDGCRRMYFGLSVSDRYLEATAVAAAVARDDGRLDAVVNMSQLTVSQMDLHSTTESRQQRLHWLSEQVMTWSGLPVVHVRPTVFLENPLFKTFCYGSMRRDGTIRLPFGQGRTSPIAARDVADVVSTILADPARHLGRVYELTGPRSRDLTDMAAEFSEALGRRITYVDVPFQQWVDEDARELDLPDHVLQHMITMARLHRAGRYDRLTDDVREVTGRDATGIGAFVRDNPGLFG